VKGERGKPPDCKSEKTGPHTEGLPFHRPTKLRKAHWSRPALREKGGCLFVPAAEGTFQPKEGNNGPKLLPKAQSAHWKLCGEGKIRQSRKS